MSASVLPPASPGKDSMSAPFSNITALLPCIVYQATLPAFETTFIGSVVTAQLGFEPGEMLGDTWFNFIHEEDRTRVEKELANAIEEGDGYQVRYRFWNKSRTQFIWFEDRGLVDRSSCGLAQRVHGVMLDITELMSAFESLQQSESRYRSMFDANPVPLWVFDIETFRFLAVNEAAVRHYGYTRDEFHAMTIADIRPPEDIDRLRAQVSTLSEGMHDAGIWRHRKKDGSIISVRVMAHRIVYEGRRAEIVLATDITEPLENARRARRAETELHHALIQTIEVLVAASEKRDPYTAGHQRRVAQFAVAIGRKLTLPDMQLEGLRLGALVHDIGKLGVPSEILVLPRRLNDVEYAMVKMHPEAGYDLLKEMKLPWPVAEMVRQHHERLDGSGYPRGLKGEEILLEARIIGLADVVEAMVSHRPYRAALGLTEAMEHVQRGRGTQYDPFVVDACMMVVREGFEFT